MLIVQTDRREFHCAQTGESSSVQSDRGSSTVQTDWEGFQCADRQGRVPVCRQTGESSSVQTDRGEFHCVDRQGGIIPLCTDRGDSIVQTGHSYMMSSCYGYSVYQSDSVSDKVILLRLFYPISVLSLIHISEPTRPP